MQVTLPKKQYVGYENKIGKNNSVFEEERGKQFIETLCVNIIISKKYITQRMSNGKAIHVTHACVLHHTKIIPNMYLIVALVSKRGKA